MAISRLDNEFHWAIELQRKTYSWGGTNGSEPVSSSTKLSGLPPVDPWISTSVLFPIK